MSDHELERWLIEQLPLNPPPDVDLRLLQMGRQLTGQRRRDPRRLRLFGAAAMLLLLLGGSWLIGLFTPGVDTSLQTLVAAGEGVFTVEPATRYRFTSHSSSLRLESGQATAIVAGSPLEITFRGGLLRVERGRGQVRILSEREALMKLTEKNWKSGTLVVVLAVTAGWGVVELLEEPHELAAGEERLIVIPPGATSPDDITMEEVTGELDTKTPSAPTVVESSSQRRLRGRVLDSETGLPVEGVRVGWVTGWVAEGVSGVALRSPKSTVFINQPAGFVIEGELVQLPLIPSPQTSFSAETRTARDGTYELPFREKEREFLMIEAPDYQVRFESKFGEDQETLETAIEPLRLVVGRLVAPEGGVPKGKPSAIHVHVTYGLAGHEGWTCERSVLLEPDFSFEVRLGSVEEADISVNAPAYEVLEQRLRVRRGTTEVTLDLVDHPHLTGRVFDENGVPIQGAELLVKSGKRGFFRDNMSHFSCTTDEDGGYLANTYGPDIEISVDMDGFAPGEFKKVPAGRPFDITLSRAENGSMLGVVVDENRKPIAGAFVQAIRDGIGLIRSHATVTDADGVFRLDDLPPGPYRMTARPPIEGAKETFGVWGREVRGAIHAGVEQKGTTVRPGEQTTGVELEIPVGATIQGTYRNEQGVLTADERLALYRPDLLGGQHELVAMVLTDEKGRFGFHGLPGGTYAVAVERISKYQLVRVSGTQVTSVHVGGETSVLAGRIFRGSEPVPNAPIALGRIEDGSIDTRLERTSGDGDFRFEGLARGTYIIHARHPDTSTVLVQVLDLEEDVDDLELDWPTTAVTVTVSGEPLPAGTELTLGLVDVEGLSLQGLVPGPYLEIARATVEKGSRFRFEGISPARYRVGLRVGERELEEEFEVGRFDVEIPLKESP